MYEVDSETFEYVQYSSFFFFWGWFGALTGSTQRHGSIHVVRQREYIPGAR